MVQVTKFKEYEEAVEGHLHQVGAGYLVNTKFQHFYLEHGMNAVNYYTEAGYPPMMKAQLNYDIKHLYGILISSANNHASAELSEHKSNHDGLSAWIKIVHKWQYGGSKDNRIKELEEKTKISFLHHRGSMQE